MAHTMNPTNTEIRKFILDTFSEDDFELLCTDYFRDAQAEFSSGMSLRIKTLRLIEYCQQRGVIENLLGALQKERPQPYAERFAPVVIAPEAPSAPCTSNPHQVFISHAHEDAEFAHQLAADLRQHGLLTWMTPDSIQPGERWITAIEHGLNESGTFLVVLTPKAVSSEWVKTEVAAAIQLEHTKKLRVIPMLREQCDLPLLLGLYQYVSFLDDYGTGFQQLLARLEQSRPTNLPRILPGYLFDYHESLNRAILVWLGSLEPPKRPHSVSVSGSLIAAETDTGRDAYMVVEEPEIASPEQFKSWLADRVEQMLMTTRPANFPSIRNHYMVIVAQNMDGVDRIAKAVNNIFHINNQVRLVIGKLIPQGQELVFQQIYHWGV
jgi:TIR domain/Effector-associated domain 7